MRFRLDVLEAEIRSPRPRRAVKRAVVRLHRGRGARNGARGQAWRTGREIGGAGAA